MGVQPEVVEEAGKIYEKDGQEKVDCELNGQPGGGGAFGDLEAVGDPLVDGPEQQQEKEADNPGAGEPARVDSVGPEVIKQAEARHKEGAEEGKEDLPACFSCFGRG